MEQHTCRFCGVDLHPERPYDYCLAPACYSKGFEPPLMELPMAMPSQFDESVDLVEMVPTDCLFEDPCHAAKEIMSAEISSEIRMGLAINEDLDFHPEKNRYFSKKSQQYLFGRRH